LNLWFNIIPQNSDPSLNQYAWKFLPLIRVLSNRSFFVSFVCFLLLPSLLVYFYFPSVDVLTLKQCSRASFTFDALLQKMRNLWCLRITTFCM